MPRIYKRYLFENKKIPRSTEYRRRKRNQLIADRNCVSSQPDKHENIIKHEGQEHLEKPGPSGSSLHTTVDDVSITESPVAPDSSWTDPTDYMVGDNVHEISTSTDSGDEKTGEDVIEDTTTTMSEECYVDGSMFSDTDNTKNVGNLYNEVVCNCTTSTVGDVLLMCLALGLRHNLSWVAQVDILKMINTLYGRDVVPATKHYYLKYLERGQDNTVMHFYCPSCEAFIGQVKEGPEGGTIECDCGKIVQMSSASTYFVSVGLESQFKTLFENDEVMQALQYRFHRNKESQDSLEDIYDGAEYRKHCNEGEILSNPLNFSYSFNTDGVPYGKSSKKTLWPIYVTLNELPPKLRAKYVLLAGIWVADHDPTMTNFLQPFVTEANKLSSEGMIWTYKGKEVNSKVIPLCCVVDSQARWRLLNMSQFTAHYGCTFCYQRTKPTTKGPRFVIPESKAPDRTHESTVADMRKAYGKRNLPQKKRLVKSVKGPSPLMTLMCFNLISGMVPDYMHCLLLGVIKEHMDLLFDSLRKQFWIAVDEYTGIEHLISAIDERLGCIKPPRSITRVPRKLRDRKLWKASEWRSWLVFYCIPCLTGILKHKHLIHISMLSTATNILLQKSINQQDLAYAQTLLMKFVFLCQEYFSEIHMVYNRHLLIHLTKAVRDWGPLWTHNAFLYEGQNRHLLQQIKSPAFVARQLVRKFQTFNALPILCQQLASSENIVEFCEDLSGRKLKHLVHCGEIVLVGRGGIPVLTPEEETVLVGKEINTQNWKSFNCMIYKGVRFCTAEYAVAFKNDDSVICTLNNNIVIIKKIIQVEQMKIILLVKQVLLDMQPVLFNEHVKVTHIRRVSGYGNMLGILACDIKSQYVFMGFHSDTFVCKMPYGCYSD